MFFVLYKDEVIRRRRFYACHAAHLDSAISNQTSTDGLGNSLQRTLHGSNCIAAARKEESPEVNCRLRLEKSRRPNQPCGPMAESVEVVPQVVAFWHMVKFPEPVHPLPPVSVHVPVTAPPVSALELDVPVTFPVSVRVFPAGVPDCTVYVKVPVTWFVESVVSVAVPLCTAP